jgi:hypothetical protein
MRVLSNGKKSKKVYVEAKNVTTRRRRSVTVKQRLDRNDGSILSSIVLLISEQPGQI